MSTWGNPFAGLRAPKVLQDGLAAVGRAQTVGAKTEREREFISAVALLYTDADTQDQRTRTLAYESAMEKIYTEVPARSRGRGVLRARRRSDGAAHRQDLRESTEGGGHSRRSLHART